MFENFMSSIEQRQKELSLDKCYEASKVCYECIYGSLENLNHRICTLKENGVHENDIPKMLWDEIGKIFSIFQGIGKSKNMSSFVLAINHLDNDVIQLNLDEKILLENLVNNYARLTSVLLKLLFDINIENETKEEQIEFCLKHIHVSKSDIAHEFGIDKKVLNKWLKHFFGDRFDAKRKIGFNDYLEIFEAFLLRADEDSFNLNLHKEKYHRRIKKGLQYRKIDIAEFCESDPKTLKKQVRDMVIFSIVDKFPPSVALAMIEKMGTSANF